MLFKIVKLVC